MKLKKSNIIITNAILASLAIGTTFSAIAEEQKDEVKEGRIEKIVVTAQKRVENVQEVPISMSAFSEDELIKMSASGDDIRVLAARVPNLNIESTFGRVYPRFYIRGLGNADFTMTATQPVALYYDEVALENPILKGMPAFDLQQIEVLRGPQGTLWGKNTPAGALHLISKKPTDDFDAYGRVTLGSYNTFNVEGAVGGSLIDGELSGRISLMSQSRDGWITNTENNEKIEAYDDQAWRGQLLWTPNNDLEVLANVHGRDLDGSATSFNAGDKKDEISLVDDHNNPQLVKQFGGSLKATYDINDLTITSITALETGEMDSQGNLAGSSEKLQHARSRINELDQFSQELRLASNNAEGFNWQTGLYYFNEEVAYDETSSDTQFFGFFLDAVQKSTSWGIFGQGTFDIAEDLKLTTGIRYTEEEKELSQSSFFFGPDPDDYLNPFADNLAWGGAGDAVQDSIKDSWDEFTGDISLAYKYTDDINFYGRFAKGFRAGTINGFAVFDPLTTVDPETVLSLEGGVKSDLLDGRLRLNLSLFVYDFKDQQLFSKGDSVNAVVLRNAEGGNGKGLEADIEYYITDELRLKASYGFADTEYEGPTYVSNPIEGGETDIDGNPFIFAPKHTGNIGLDYYKEIESGGEIFASTDWSYRSENYFTVYKAEEYKGEGYWEGSARLGWRSDNYEVALWGRNLTDVEEVLSNLTFTGAKVYTGPRTFGIDFIMRFY